jgi:DmsE family decaheme c-type cytochrome
MNMLLQIITIFSVLVSTAHSAESPASSLKETVIASPGEKASSRSADALNLDAVCTRCHDETESKPILSLYQTPHGNRGDFRSPSCRTCHGDSEAHVKGGNSGGGTRPAPDFVFNERSKSYNASSADERSDQCLSCHESGLRTHWTGSQHQAQGVACNSCHSVHVSKDPVLERLTQPDVCFTCHKTQRSETHLFSTHPILAGKTACSECHNSHGSMGPKLLLKNTVNETCYTCHAEYRGPFLWEHAPVFDDCLNCHTSHGSNNSPLLKQRTPWLCQDCHTADHAAMVNSGANLIGGDVTTADGLVSEENLAPRAQLNGRNCLSCHSMIHGSNHPAGSKFNR